MDPAAGLQCRGHRAEHDDDRALGANVSIGRGVERTAKPGRRQHRGPREADIGKRREQQIDAAHDGGVDRSVADRLCGHVESDHRRGTGRIDCQARSAQIESIGDAVGHDAERVARHHVHAGGRRIGEEVRGVIDRRGADIDADGTAGQRRVANAGMGDGVVRDFEQVTMLRIDLLRFARTHAKGCCVETPDIVNDAGGKRVAAAYLVGGWMIVGLRGKAIGRDLADAAAVGAQQFPELVAVARAGQTAGIADDGNFIPACHFAACLPAYPAVVFDRPQIIPKSPVPTVMP